MPNSEEEGPQRPGFNWRFVVGSLLLAIFLLISLLVIFLHGVYEFQRLERLEIRPIKQRISELEAIIGEELMRVAQERVEAQLKENYEQGRRVLSNMDEIRRQNNDPLPTRSHFGALKGSRACEDGNTGQCVGRFGKGLPDFYMISPRYKTLACLVQKNMSTLLQAIMCYLLNANENRFRAAGYNLSFIGQTLTSTSDPRGYQSIPVSLVFRKISSRHRLCEMKDIHGSIKNALLSTNLSSEAEEWMVDSWSFLAVVREPVDRFLSGFLDKCIRQPIEMKNTTTPNIAHCNGCRANLTCFIITEYERLKQFELRAREMAGDLELLKLESTNEDFHFFPQNWRCNFEKLLPRYTLLKYTPPQRSNHKVGYDYQTALSPQLMTFLEKVGVSRASIEYIREHVENDRTVHLTRDSEARRFLEQRLRSSPFLMEFIVRMFYHDFRLFRYDLPSFRF